jgi:hypothetical protein
MQMDYSGYINISLALESLLNRVAFCCHNILKIIQNICHKTSATDQHMNREFQLTAPYSSSGRSIEAVDSGAFSGALSD